MSCVGSDKGVSVVLMLEETGVSRETPPVLPGNHIPGFEAREHWWGPRVLTTYHPDSCIPVWISTINKNVCGYYILQLCKLIGNSVGSN